MSWALDRDWCAVVVDGKRHSLSEQNYLILEKLVDNQGRMMTVDALAAAAGLAGSSRKHMRAAMSAHMRGIRRVIGQREIVTITPFGYALKAAYRDGCPSCGRAYPVACEGGNDGTTRSRESVG